MVARGEAIDRTTQALAVGSLKALEGVYGEGCVERSGSWSLALEGDAKLEAPPLSVVKDDSACELSIRAVIADERIELVAPLVLQEDYASKPAQVGNDKATFFINAKISSSKMTDSFKVTVLYSDDPRAVADSYGASYATVAASGSMETVVAPDYKIDFAGGGLKVLVNAKSVVSSAEGSAVLAFGSVPGDAFVVDGGKLPESPSLAMVDEVYRAFTETAVDAKGDVKVPASAFTLAGASLAASATRTIIIRGGSPSMPAYQLVRVTFNPPKS